MLTFGKTKVANKEFYGAKNHKKFGMLILMSLVPQKILRRYNKRF